MTTLLFAAVFLICLTALAIYIAGWEFFIFGVAAGIAIIGGWWVWVGAAIATVQAARFGWRRWSGRDSTPVSS